MFFDADQTLGAIQQVERPRPAPRPVPSPLVALVVGILIGRKTK